MSDEPKVSEEYPELHHYTDWGGLEGIFTSRTLWATHFSKLNDYTEIMHLEEFLAEAVAKKLEEYASFRCLTDHEFRDSMSRMGNIREACQHDAKNSVATLYDVTFRGRSIDKDNEVLPFVEPFITSFCSHSHDSTYESNNGLLSQWSRYSHDEGYAIVFDTETLEDRLRKEKEIHGYHYLSFNDVIYNDDKLNFVEIFSKEIEEVFNVSREFIFDTENVSPFQAFDPLIHAATRFKHRGFKEEREVRIVACPARRDFEEYLKAEQPETYEAPDGEIKTIYSEPNEHVCLYDSDISQPLPIKRIIVGPNRRQQQLHNRVKQLVEDHIEVVCSETPYRAN